jgi:Flp pilus assembly protein TadG
MDGPKLARQDGVAMTEFALVLPVFLVIVAGMLAFGRVFFYWISANHTANETARWAAVDRNPFAPTTLKSHARNSVTQEFSNNATICITLPNGAAVGRPVTVTVEAPFSFVPLLDVGTLTIRGSATMRIERLAGPGGTTPAAYTADPVNGACAP